MGSRVLRVLIVVGSLTILPALRAQEVTSPVAIRPATAQTDAVTHATLDRVIALHLDQVSFGNALAAVASEGHVHLVYSSDQVPLTKTVSLVVDQITVGDALHLLLQGTGLTATVSAMDRIMLESAVRAPAHSVPMQQGSATISGLVTDSGTGAIITQAIVHVDGTQLTVRTNATGHYTISNLAAGEYRVTARHVGYLSKTRVVTLTDSGAKAIDFQLNQPATTLNEVVTTALGDMRRYQVGNVIATINVDSIAPNAPVTSVTDLISGRAPGVDVMESSGMVGSGEAIRIRGISSLLLQGDPIIIVDGIRVDNTPGGQTFRSYIEGPSPYRLNDLDYSQIQSIDILKGPAATTEYGTDGANGVIVITTKRGMAGGPQWNAAAEQSAYTVPLNYPPITWNWGHATDGTGTPLTNPNGAYNNHVHNNAGCPVVGAENFYEPGMEYGSCVVDSTTAFDPLDHAATTPYGTGPASKLNLDVGGGSDALRYYLAGGAFDQTGVYQLPPVFRGEAKAVGFSNSVTRPNTEDQGNLAGNVMIKASPTVDVQASVRFLSTYADFPNVGNLQLGEIPALDDSLVGYGYGSPYIGTAPQYTRGLLAQVLGNNTSQGTERWTGGVTVNWRPRSWLVGQVTAGIDHEAQSAQSEFLPQAALLRSQFSDTSGGGNLTQQEVRQDIYNVNLRESATATLWHVLGLVTSVGAQYVDQRDYTVGVSAYNLAADEFTIYGGTLGGALSAQAAVKSGGLYVEESLNFSDRCYAPLGLRFDVASGYGTGVSGTQNPNFSLTCTILTGRTSLRLRGAYGISDQQPPYGASLSTYQVTTGQAATDPTSSTVYTFYDPGNPEVKPERDQEIEGGFDLGLWHERVQVGFTAYNKRAHDMLWAQSLGQEIEGTYVQNIGDVQNEGLEGTVTTTIVETRPLTLGVTVNANVNHNKVITLSPDFIQNFSHNEVGFQTIAPGYPLYGFWGYPISYTTPASGELTQFSGCPPFISGCPDNIQEQYAGSSVPIEEVSVAPTVGLFRNKVMINAMLDYEGDFKVVNKSCFGQDIFNALCTDGANELGQPLWEQAVVLGDVTGLSSGQLLANSALDGTYLAFRELSIAVNLPRTWARAVRVRSISLVGAVRNVALWTRYPYGDPETANSDGSVGYSTAVPGTSPVIDNDIRAQTVGTVPLTRQITVRINAGF